MSGTMRRLREWYRAKPGYWFVPKMFGFGATPVTWQGWAVILGYAALLLAVFGLLRSTVLRLAVAVPLTLALLLIIARKTEGGLRWHWGLPE